MTNNMDCTDKTDRAKLLFGELRQIVDNLDNELALTHPGRQLRRQKVFQLLGQLLREEIIREETIELPGQQNEPWVLGIRILRNADREESELFGETLGQVLETLIREDEGKDTGTYYTSREVVTLMCRLALWNYLGQKINRHGVNWRDLGRLIFKGKFEPATEWGESRENRENRESGEAGMSHGSRESGEALLTLVRQVRVLDPAVGSGAFLLGMLRELTALRRALGENLPTATIRQQVIEHNMFGVDREAAAVEVVKLRLGLLDGNVIPRVVYGDSLFLHWQQHFPEVMAAGGFDIILANPPYVSQDRLEKNYKDRLAEAYSQRGLKAERKADLYVYFYALAAQILGPGGTGVIISSTAWLDVDYGAHLQKFLLDNFSVPLILDSSKERWFEGAAVNTAIVVLNRDRVPGTEKWRSTAFLTLRQGLRQAGDKSGETEKPMIEQEVQPLFEEEGKLIEELERALRGEAHSGENACLRVNAVSCAELKAEGISGEVPAPGGRYEAVTAGVDGRYGGAKWGKYLRAPGVYFRLIATCREKLCCLGDIARIKRGFTTGCNEFFYVRAGMESPVESRYLRPVIKSPRETLGFMVEQEKLKFKVVLISDPEHQLGQGAAAYIKWGETRGYNLRPSLAVKNPWWQLVKTEFPALIFRRFFNEKFNLPYLPSEIAEDQTFYGVYYQGDPLVLAAIMNSTLTWLFIELHGRTALGEGVLQYAVYEAARLPVINPACLGTEARQNLREIFRQMGERKALDLEQELASPDRRQLDFILLKELGMPGEAGNESLQDELYREFLRLVQARLEKAKK